MNLKRYYEDTEIGFFLIGIGAFCCVAISFMAIFLGIAQRIGSMREDYELNRGGSFGVFESDNNRSVGRNSRAVRRSGGSSRSGGGGKVVVEAEAAVAEVAVEAEAVGGGRRR